jgi:hypothetical protein
VITTDGERSKKRLWFGKKLLEQIKSLDIPAKALRWNGFLFRSWQQGDVSGGIIKAPTGAVVVCSNHYGMFKATADNWLGGFETYIKMRVSDFVAEDKEIRLFHNQDSELENPYFTPVSFLSAATDIYGTFVSGSTLMYYPHPPSPVITSFKGAEAYYVSVSGHTLHSTTGWQKYVAERQFHFYDADGGYGRIGFDVQLDINTAVPKLYSPDTYIQQLSEYSLAVFQPQTATYGYELESKLISYDITMPETFSAEDGVIHGFEQSATFLSDVLPEGSIPDELRTLLLADEKFPKSHATYCFELNGTRTTLHIVDVADKGYFLSDPTTPVKTYFDSHPEMDKWRLFFILRVGTTSYVHNLEQFVENMDSLSSLGVLAGVSGDEHTVDFAKLYGMFSKFCLTPPIMSAGVIPSDSYMFHGHNGNVYVYTRKYGIGAFTPSGFFFVNKNNYISGTWSATESKFYTDHTATADALPPMVLPTLAEGVRPEIAYSKTVDGSPVYVCFCVKKNPCIKFVYKYFSTGPVLQETEPPSLGYNISEVTAVYVGSPFTSWTQLPMPAASLLAARPYQVDSRVVLLGVVKEYKDEEYVYRLAYLDWNGDGEWQLLGALPFPVEHSDIFAIGLFGDKVFDANSFPAIATPQMFVAPYSEYAIGQP